MKDSEIVKLISKVGDQDHQIKEMKNLIHDAQYTLTNLRDVLSPDNPSWTDRQFNQVMKLLREAKEVK